MKTLNKPIELKNEIQKEKILQSTVNVIVDPEAINKIEVYEEYVRLTIRAWDGVKEGSKIFICDQRAESLSEAKKIPPQYGWKHKNDFAQVMSKPACVAVMKKTYEDGCQFYINLFDTKNNIPYALFSVNLLRERANTVYDITDNSIFCWRSKFCSDRNGSSDLIFIALTTAEKLAVIQTFVNQKGSNIHIMGEEIKIWAADAA